MSEDSYKVKERKKKCDHVEPHEYDARPKTVREALFREFLLAGGWLGSGYCFAYYPAWMNIPFEAHLKKIGWVEDDQPEGEQK